MLVRFGGRIPCADGAEWWFEYGPTPAYGQRTASNTGEAIQGPGSASVRTFVDGLDYGVAHHHRLVVRYPDGRVEAGADVSVLVTAGTLRPPQRVSLRLARAPTRTRTEFKEINVVDAPAGASVSVSCSGSRLCRAPQRKIALEDERVVFRNWSVGTAGLLSVVVSGRAGPIGTTIQPRPRRPPVTSTSCNSYPVTLFGKCVTVGLNARGPRVARVSVRDAAHGSEVEFVCRGPGCPADDLGVRVVARGADPYRTLTPTVYRRLRPGAVLRVFVTRPALYGVTRVFRVTRREVRAGSYRCLARGGSRRIVRCPRAVPVAITRG